MTKRIPTRWLQGTDNKETVEKAVRALMFSEVGRQLLKILEDKHQSAEAKSWDYSQASWPYIQAHMNGYRQCAQEILDLFKFTEE
jgi:hypothetical protein